MCRPGMFLAPPICNNEPVMNASLACLLLSALFAPAASVAPPRAVPATIPRSSSQTVTVPAKGRLLIAGRNLRDPNFAETVVLLLSYEPRGAMGIVINRPTEVQLATALPNLAELSGRADRLFAGGPVGVNGILLLVRAKKPPQASEQIFGDVYGSGRLSTLRQALGKKGKTDRVRAYAGYAGWGPGQLDQEIARGDWYVTDADPATVFDMPAPDIWPKLINRFSGQWTRATRLLMAARSEEGRS